MRKIGIYGGSFDPVHKGHTKMMKEAIDLLDLDILNVVPAFISPFKTKKDNAKAEDRIKMLELVLPPKAQICDFEIKRNNVSYTIDTVKYIKNKYPDCELYLIIGSDNLTKLHKWKDIDLIAQLAKIAVLRRSKNINKINLKKYNGILLNNKIHEFSSSEYKKGAMDTVASSVAEYIGHNLLYAKDIVHNCLSAKRAKHSQAAATFAANLAKKHGYDAKVAYHAGLFHDIAKEWSAQNSTAYMQYCNVDPNQYKKFQYHQICGYLWLKNEYKCDNQELLHAIKVHTSMEDLGDTNLSTLDKIVYIADKICEGRKYPGIQKVRELVFEDLDKGFKEVVKNNLILEKQKGTKFDALAQSVYKNILGDEYEC
ncbi:nicotinate-nucleotide adenylyltransferase [Mycoplasmopsis ciconiae]|uniref:Probable nicotinate-nucleotide adenylyltransferase n=1 Tax=Mycoplasmopsis ciconiae TaxID=561067 RepID=A0ABU7MKD0_9BACT|nr:nicotinate-nucleotide adenylyltransferase [Mycoplasmopsis ciconiae]